MISRQAVPQEHAGQAGRTQLVLSPVQGRRTTHQASKPGQDVKPFKGAACVCAYCTRKGAQAQPFDMHVTLDSTTKHAWPFSSSCRAGRSDHGPGAAATANRHMQCEDGCNQEARDLICPVGLLPMCAHSIAQLNTSPPHTPVGADLMDRRAASQHAHPHNPLKRQFVCSLQLHWS